MPWGTEFLQKVVLIKNKTIKFVADIFLIRQTFRTIAEIQDSIKDEEQSLQYYKEKLLMLIIANPKDLLKDDESVIWEMHTSFNDIWTEVLDTNLKIYKLNLYLDYVKEHGIKQESED